jgi:hypothetical protein
MAVPHRSIESIPRSSSSLNPFGLPSDFGSRSTPLHVRPQFRLNLDSRSICCPWIDTCKGFFSLVLRVATGSRHRWLYITAQSVPNRCAGGAKPAHLSTTLYRRLLQAVMLSPCSYVCRRLPRSPSFYLFHIPCGSDSLVINAPDSIP